MSDDRPSVWGPAPPPQGVQPATTRQCPQCGWPTAAAEPVCRNCGTDARLGARPFAPGYRASSTNGLAVASLVLGILWIYWIGSVLALVFGYIARRQIAERQGMQDGRGMATAGIVLGWVGIGFLALIIVLGIAGMASDPVYDALPFR